MIKKTLVVEICSKKGTMHVLPLVYMYIHAGQFLHSSVRHLSHSNIFQYSNLFINSRNKYWYSSVDDVLLLDVRASL